MGAGPAGLFTAAGLVAGGARVEVFERHPLPYGLLRYGVAPDHTAIRSLMAQFDALLPNITLHTGVELGRDVTLAQLRQRFDRVVLAVGAPRARSLAVPGADLPGSLPAGHVVGWYNGHPQFADLELDLDKVRRVVIIGVGNVAMDVARILTRVVEGLRGTSIAPRALAALERSAIEHVDIIGRRDQANAAYTPKERRELEQLAVRSWDMHFLASPAEVLGSERVSAVRLEHNELVTDADGRATPRGTGRTWQLEAQLVLAAIGYQAVPIDGVPWDAQRRCIPVDEQGRVMDGVYAVGWARTGPRGLLGEAKKGARQLVRALLQP